MVLIDGIDVCTVTGYKKPPKITYMIVIPKRIAKLFKMNHGDKMEVEIFHEKTLTLTKRKEEDLFKFNS